ncbi:MAG: DUF1302 domain-containing protein [Parvibaculaceae bacterium]
MDFLLKPVKRGARSAAAALLLSSPLVFAAPAQALEYNIGDLQLYIDTTVSASAAMRTESRSCAHISYFNNGCLKSDGSGWDVNHDDGNINAAKNDIFSAPIKIISEVSGSWENYGFYLSGKAFHDAAVKNINNHPNTYGPIGNAGAFRADGRPLKDALRGDGAYNAALQDAEILDAYVYADWNVAGLPLNVRLGNQVVSWGESTFIQGGVSSYLPFDVAALYQPGLELKEVFLPQGTAYAALGLPGNFSVEAMYVYEHEKSELPACGTLFSVSDALGQGCAYGVSTGEYFPGAGAGVYVPPVVLPRGADQGGRDQGQYGFALRYYADWMGQGTDLAAYFVNFHSKLPIGTFTALDDNFGVLGFTNLLCGGSLSDPACTHIGGSTMGASDDGTAIEDWILGPSRLAYGLAIGSLGAGNKSLHAYYPEDIKMIGASFNTSVTFLPEIFGDGTALSGDLAFYPDMPFQVDTTEILAHDYALYGFTADPGEAPIYTGEMVAAGQVVPGARETEALHGSITTLSTLTPSNWFVKNTGGDFGVLLINAGFQYLPDADGNRFAIPGSHDTHANPGVAIALGDLCQTPGGPATQNCNLKAEYASDFSAGYRMYAFQDYHTAFGTGWTVTPNLFWAHDVTGYSAGPIGPGFIEGKKTLKLGVDATYQSFKVGLGYTMHFGAELKNNDYDKDFMSLTASYAF